jgi:hypothetical protein
MAYLFFDTAGLVRREKKIYEKIPKIRHKLNFDCLIGLCTQNTYSRRVSSKKYGEKEREEPILVA